MHNKKHLNKIQYLQISDNIPALEEKTLYITNSPELASELISAGYPTAAHSVGNTQFPGVQYVLENIEELEDEDYERIYRRLSGLPWDILETERLYIRETTVDDVNRLVELYADDSVTRFMEDLYPMDKEKEYLNDYINNIYAFYEIGMWSLCRKEDDMLIGRIGIEYTEEDGVVEMGFMLGVDFRDKGYATEAGMAIIEYAKAFPYITRIKARVHKDNRASISLCKRMGFEYEGEDTSSSLTIWKYDLK